MTAVQVKGTAERLDALRLIGSFGSGNVMAGELSRLTRRALRDFRLEKPKKDGASSVAYPFDPRLAAVALRYHRTSARLLWELYRSTAARLEPLYDDLRSLIERDPRDLFDDGMRISVQTHFVEQFAAGERQVVGAVKNAFLDGMKSRGIALSVDANHPDVLVDVRMRDDAIVVSLDLAGGPVHQRGYRLRSGDAPLREDVAALMVMLARHDSRTEPLLDPMAGAGTIGIEAAALASARPGFCGSRTPPAGTTKWFGETLEGLGFERLSEPLFADTRARVLLNDADAESSEAAQQNAERAGVSTALSYRVGDFRDWDKKTVQDTLQASGFDSGGGLILCNPPYGHRLGEVSELLELYGDLWDWCRQFQGFRAGFIVTEPDPLLRVAPRPRMSKPLRNGSLKVTFLLFDV